MSEREKAIGYDSYLGVDAEEKTARRKTCPCFPSGLPDVGISSVNHFLHSSVAFQIFCSVHMVFLHWGKISVRKESFLTLGFGASLAGVLCLAVKTSFLCWTPVRLPGVVVLAAFLHTYFLSSRKETKQNKTKLF